MSTRASDMTMPPAADEGDEDDDDDGDDDTASAADDDGGQQQGEEIKAMKSPSMNDACQSIGIVTPFVRGFAITVELYFLFKTPGRS